MLLNLYLLNLNHLLNNYFLNIYHMQYQLNYIKLVKYWIHLKNNYLTPKLETHILAKAIAKLSGKNEKWANLVMYAKRDNLDDWNLLSEAEKDDILAHQAMDRYWPWIKKRESLWKPNFVFSQALSYYPFNK